MSEHEVPRLRCPRCGYERDTPNHELGCAAGRAEQPPGMNDWATFPIGSCGTCDGGGCPDCTDPVG